MSCKKYRKLIWLFFHNELSEDQIKEMEAHLNLCVQCKEYYQQASQLNDLLGKKSGFNLSEAELDAERKLLINRIKVAKRFDHGENWREKVRKIILFDFRPVLRPVVASLMLLLGALLGSQLYRTQTANTGSEILETDLSTASIERIRNISYDEQTGNVVVHLQTIEDKIVRGDAADPLMQKILAKALMSDSRPNMRLRSIKAIVNAQSLDQSVLEALIFAMKNDQNPGIRLKAMKKLTSIPLDEWQTRQLTKEFINILIFDKNPAMRIQAIDALAKIRNKSIERAVNRVALTDSNEYVRNKAAFILNQLKPAKIEKINY